MIISRAVFTLLAAATLAACAKEVPAPVPAPMPAPRPQPYMLSDPLAFETCRRITLRTEVIDFSAPAEAEPTIKTRRLLAEHPQTARELMRGLKGRKDLAAETAVLLEFDGDHNPVLWMQDTPASLDMVFVDADGAVFYLEEATTPFSEAFLTPEDPDPIARFVLKLPAGGAERLGITPGMTTVTLGDEGSCASLAQA